MKRISLVLAALLAAGLTLAPATLFGFTIINSVDVSLYGTRIEGNATPNLPVTVTVTDKDGAVKAIDRGLADGSGDFIAYLPVGQILPGDTVQVQSGAGVTVTHTISRLALTKINVKDNIIAGLVFPRQDQVRAEVTSYYDQTAAPAADGAFSFDLNPYDLKRLDGLKISYRPDPIFTVSLYQNVIGLRVGENTQVASLYGKPGKSYTVRLLSPLGRLKGACLTNLTPSEMGGPIQFVKAGGAPIPIRAGDFIQVIGYQGFTVRVAPLLITIDTAADTVTVKSLSNNIVDISLYLMDDSGVTTRVDASATTTADGTATFTFPGKDIRTGDYVDAHMRTPIGNLILCKSQSLP